MNNEKYWEKRAAWDIYKDMEKAENTADVISNVYRKSSRWLQLRIEEIFEKYQTENNLSEEEAKRLLAEVDAKTVQDMLEKLKNGESDKTKKELIAKLEAPAYSFRISRLSNLLEQIDTMMQNVYHQEIQTSTAFYESLAKEAYYRSVYNNQVRSGYAFSFSHISKKQIDRVLSMNWSGKHYSARIWKNTSQLSEAIKEELLVGMLTGRTERETAEILQAKFAVGAMQARRLVRTESCFISNELTAAGFEECGIEHYRFLATLDLRTSKMCRELDQKVFPMAERKTSVNYPPMHPWCRSTTLSTIRDEDLKRWGRDAYNPKTRRKEKVPGDMTYAEWYKKYVEGDPDALAQEKAEKNYSSDKKQYERYKEILGKDAPKTFAKFQDMKYNDSEKWEMLKKKVSTYREIDKKEWTDEFKQKTKTAYKKFEKEGIYLSTHALSRLPRLNKKGYIDIQEDSLFNMLKGEHQYIENEDRLVFFDKELQLSCFKDKTNGEIISIVRRKNPKEEWIDVQKNNG